MKSYIDLGQSKQLMEFLPIESADMFWLVLGNTSRIHVLTEPLSNYSRWENYPCWSLAALLAQMPCVELVSSRDNKYRVFWEDRFSEWHESAIDACVELILREKKEKGK